MLLKTLALCWGACVTEAEVNSIPTCPLEWGREGFTSRAAWLPLTFWFLISLVHFQLCEQADKPLKGLLVSVDPDEVNLKARSLLWC